MAPRAETGKDAAARVPRCALSIAGFDPSGGAGVSADLRVFRHFGLYGLAALTAVTPQNTRGVKAVHPLNAKVLRGQLEAVFEDFPLAAAKTGQIPDRSLVAEVVRVFERVKIPLVVDPVLKPTHGRTLADAGALAALRDRLLPLAAVATPNWREAASLCGLHVDSRAGMERAAWALVPRLTTAVVITGGDGLAEGAWDLFFDGKVLRWFRTKRRPVGEVHGTGCHFSAALAAGLALGKTPDEATALAKKTVSELIDRRLLDFGGRLKLMQS